MYVHCIYSAQLYIYRSVCPLVMQSYTKEDEAVNPLTSRKYSVLNGNCVFNLCNFDLHNIFQENIPGIK
jgi:hypothetical protein